MTFWSTEFGMSPWNEGADENNMKYLLHYYMVCLICFTMSFIVEYMNGRRYNMQAKALRDHNPLIKRKGLQSLTKQQSTIDTSLTIQKERDEKRVMEQWKAIQMSMKKAERQGKSDADGRSFFDFEQVKQTTIENDDEIKDEILSIPNNIKLYSTLLYGLTHIFTLMQLMVIFATLDFFVLFFIICGSVMGFIMFGFKRRRAFLYIYNPLGSLVNFAFES